LCNRDGEAGAGKSALAAALEGAEGMVPAGFVQAIALIDEATTPHELARAQGSTMRPESHSVLSTFHEGCCGTWFGHRSSIKQMQAEQVLGWLRLYSFAHELRER
jgi:hypothetical protein